MGSDPREVRARKQADAAALMAVLAGLLCPLANGCGTSATAARTAPRSITADELRCEQDSDCFIEGEYRCVSCPEEPFARRRCDLSPQGRVLPYGACHMDQCILPGWRGDCEPVHSPAAYRAVCVAGVCERRLL